MELILSCIAALSFILFNLFVHIVFGCIPSISDTWYALRMYGKKTGKDYLERYFSIWMCFIPMLLIHPLYSITDGLWLQWFVLPMLMGIVIVGAAPDYYNKKYLPWHVVGAVLAAVCAVVISIGLGWIWLLLGVIGVSYLIQYLTTPQDKIYWLENSAYITIILLCIMENL